VGIYTAHGAVQTLPVADLNVNLDTFEAATDVTWDPTEAVTGDDVAGWVTIPVYDGTLDYPKTITPESGYHTIENVKAGKGDPCRLVGLDLAKIKNTAANALTTADIDNGKWRLPTPAEQLSFSGRVSNGAYTEHWTVLSGVNGSMYPNATLGDATTFLPATGSRYNNAGRVWGQSAYGVYWSSTPLNATYGGYSSFSTVVVNPLSGSSYADGFSVRCVLQ
jgi:hypothetical protein